MIAPIRIAPKAADLFAGFGGFTAGAKAAGAIVVVAINHDAHAIANHAANHQDVRHFQENVWDVMPRSAFGPGVIDLLLASPDCRHFSKAKGGATVDKGIRGLAWVVLRWAAQVRPKVVILENVEEFQTWGPLNRGHRPIKAKAGQTFQRLVQQLRDLGYVVEWRMLVAADYGAPTTRERLFMVARCDGLPIVWPEPTHGPGRTAPYRTAAECIDFWRPVLSIFATAAEAKAWARAQGIKRGFPKRPLAPATQRRIAEGVRRFVLENPRPFIVQVNHGRDTNRSQGLDRPFPTIATGTGAHGFGIVVPSLVNTRNGERDGQAPRVRSVEDPFLTVTARGSQGALVAAFLAKHYGGPNGNTNRGIGADEPLGAVTAQDHHALVAACMVRTDNQSDGHLRGVADVEEPLRTITSAGGHAVLAAHLTKFYGSCASGSSVDEPMPTVTASGERGGGHAGLVAAFLCKYYGATVGQVQPVDEPIHTIPTKARFGLVTVLIDGEAYVLADIGMRMLQPRELARAQGFDDDYVLIGTKAQQTARIGNSVSPPVAEALVRSNLPDGVPGQLALFEEAA